MLDECCMRIGPISDVMKSGQHHAQNTRKKAKIAHRDAGAYLEYYRESTIEAVPFLK
jgi:hypothetical protein